jgi:hypothetical protein
VLATPLIPDPLLEEPSSLGYEYEGRGSSGTVEATRKANWPARERSTEAE